LRHHIIHGYLGFAGLLIIELSKQILKEALCQILEEEICHITRNCSKFITLLPDNLLVSNTDYIILGLLLSILACGFSHFILLCDFFRSEIADFSQNFDKFALTNAAIPLDSKLIDPIQACMIEIIALSLSGYIPCLSQSCQHIFKIHRVH
jgi:hypothetical protein